MAKDRIEWFEAPARDQRPGWTIWIGRHPEYYSAQAVNASGDSIETANYGDREQALERLNELLDCQDRP